VFSEEKALDRSLSDALDSISAWEPLFKSNLMKPYIVYSLMIALVHLHGSFAGLAADKLPTGSIRAAKRVIANLTALNDALNYEVNEVPSDYKAFVAACANRTNVKAQRLTRIRWLLKALLSDEL
jgi:hypothetical protein